MHYHYVYRADGCSVQSFEKYFTSSFIIWNNSIIQKYFDQQISEKHYALHEHHSKSANIHLILHPQNITFTRLFCYIVMFHNTVPWCSILYRIQHRKVQIMNMQIKSMATSLALV